MEKRRNKKQAKGLPAAEWERIFKTAKVEAEPKLEGRQMIMILAPR